MLGKPVIDQTGLTGRYDIRLPRPTRTGPNRSPEALEEIRQTVLDQLGLDLMATNTPIEVLVVKSVKP
jgi:uncharacterized protein (TIGR03435 family)